MGLIGLITGNAGKIASIFGVVVGFLLLYPRTRLKIPADFIRNFLDSTYIGMRKAYWYVVLFLNGYKKTYCNVLIKHINASNYCHINSMASADFSPTSELFIKRYVHTYQKRQDPPVFSAASSTKLELPKDFSNLVVNNELPRKVTYVLAPAGYGKSSLAKKVCIDLIDNNHRIPIFLDFTDKQTQKFFLQLKNDENNDSFGAVCKLSRLAVECWRRNNLSVPPQFFEQHLKKGCYVIADGFDEIECSKQRLSLMRWLESLNRYYDKCVFVVFSRPYAFEELQARNSCAYSLDGFRPEQIEKFVLDFFRSSNEKNKYFKSIDPQEYFKEFLRRIESDPTLVKMVENPLLLTFMLHLHYNGKQLPENKSLLCGSILESSISWHRDELNQNQIKNVMDILSGLSYATYFNDNKIKIKKEIDRLVVGSGFASKDDLSKHLIHNSAVVEVIDWESLSVRFVHTSFLEFCAAWQLSNNHCYEFVANICDNPKVKEVLQFYVYQEADLTPLFKRAEMQYKKNPKRKLGIIKTLYWIQELVEGCDEKLTNQIINQLKTQLKNGVKTGVPAFVGIHLHLRLSRLLSSDPIDRYPLQYKEWSFLGLDKDMDKRDSCGTLTGCCESDIHNLVLSINKYYGLNEGEFCIPDIKIIPFGFKDDAIVSTQSRFRVFNPESKRFKKIQNTIKENIILDFYALRDKVFTGEVNFSHLISDEHILSFVDEIMMLWTPNIIIDPETPDVHMGRKKLYREFEKAFYPDGGRSVDEFVKNEAALKILLSFDEQGALINDIVHASWDSYSIRTFNESCFTYIEEKTKLLIKSKAIYTWGKIHLSYQSPFVLNKNYRLGGVERRRKTVEA